MVKFWGVVLLDKMHIVSEAVIGKVQTYPIPKNVKEVQAFVGILGFGGLSFPIWHNASISHHLVKKGTYRTGYQSNKLPLTRERC